MRISKYISNAGICSRREAEKLVLQKKVYINNRCCEQLYTQALEEQNKLEEEIQLAFELPINYMVG